MSSKLPNLNLSEDDAKMETTEKCHKLVSLGMLFSNLYLLLYFT